MANSGQTTVTTAGTEVVMAADQPCYWVLYKGKTANTGLMFVGNGGANTVSSTTGFQLAAGDVGYYDWEGKLGNLNQLYVDSAVDGEGISWICG